MAALHLEGYKSVEEGFKVSFFERMRGGQGSCGGCRFGWNLGGRSFFRRRGLRRKRTRRKKNAEHEKKQTSAKLGHVVSKECETGAQSLENRAHAQQKSAIP